MGASVYRTRTPRPAGQAETLVVCCSSSPYLPPTMEFVHDHLGLAEGSYFLLAVPGGAQFLLAGEHLPKFAWAGQRWVRFFSDRLKVRRIVLVGHDECVWYAASREAPAFLHGLLGEPADRRERDDLARIAAVVRSFAAAAAVEAYFAEKTADDTVAFSREV